MNAEILKELAALLAITLSANIADEQNGRREAMGEGKKEGEGYFL